MTEIDYAGTIRGELADTLLKEARKRKQDPVALLADILETVLRDNLVTPVLDDGI